jgi:hypothetical protein
MTEVPGEGLLSEVAEDAVGVAETGIHAAEAIGHAAAGDMDGTADSAISTSESALGVATFGASELVEAGWDAVANATGLPTAHEALYSGTQAAGGALGDGLEHLVGDDQALKSVNAFDDGDILGGLGHMAEGAGQTITGAVEHGVSAVGSALGELFESGESGQGAADTGQPVPANDAPATDAPAYDAQADYDASAGATDTGS